jgi:Major Facilitator Superfamily.
MQKYGARAWLTRIMGTWGLVAAAMAFVWNDTSFYVLRFLLGVAEAGFFPGVVFYFTQWLPQKERGKACGFSLGLRACVGAVRSDHRQPAVHSRIRPARLAMDVSH